MGSVLFVCLGNICRSPMAEGIARARLVAAGRHDVAVESAGTAGYHEGEPADARTLDVLRRKGQLCELIARQVRDDDFERFDLILAMDRANLRDLRDRCPPAHQNKLRLMLEPTTGGDVPDPYYGGKDGFDQVYRLLDQAMDAWLDAL